VSWKTKDIDIAQWVIYMQYGSEWEYVIYTKSETSASIPIRIKKDEWTTTSTLKNITVTAIDRSGNESESFMVPIQ